MAKTTKEIIKNIRDLAKKLPKVYEQCATGKHIKDGKLCALNVYNVEINHERRIRKAYERSGMNGVSEYLETIMQLQKKRYEKFKESTEENKPELQGVSVE